MNKAVEFIGREGLYFLTTVRNGKPRVRPFAFCYDYQDRILIPTQRWKNCYLEMRDNPHIELCACQDDDWIRISGTVKECKDIKAKEAFFRNVPTMKNYFSMEDPDFVLFELSGTMFFFDNNTLLSKEDF